MNTTVKIKSIDRHLRSNPIPLPDTSREAVKAAKNDWRAARVAVGASDSAPDLLTGASGDVSGQTKLAKGKGARIAGLTLSPAEEIAAIANRVKDFDLSDANACDFYTPQCRDLCLKGTGRQAFDYAALARMARTYFLIKYPNSFATLVVHELDKAAKKYGPLDFRPDILSDLSWDVFMPWLADLGSVHVVYGYTKNLRKARRWQALDGWHVTFSASERTNADRIKEIVGDGINVAIPVDLGKKDALPILWANLPVVDGDENDRRYKDGNGVAVLLRAKVGMGNRAAMDNTPVGITQFIKPALVE